VSGSAENPQPTDPAATPGTAAARQQPPAWWSDAVVYQIYPRSFADSNGDGVGDINGIRSRLDHLVDLGIDVVWLSPIYASPQFDNGYDISDYRAIAPEFGTLEEFEALLGEMHERGIKLVMDLVVNHTSHEHAWFRESRSSADNPKRDWYWWRKPRKGFEAGRPGAEPNNWGAAFAGSAWTLDETTGEYYLHLFAEQQPDLNWENPEVREAVYEMMNWWLDRGVDGFRMDVINFISKDVALPDGPKREGALFGDGHRSFISGPRIHEFLQEMYARVFEGREADLLTVGEMPGVTVEDARLFTDPARKELDMVFQFEHMDVPFPAPQNDEDEPFGYDPKWHAHPLDLAKLKESFGRWQDELAEVGWNSLYLDNHDRPRVVSRFGNDREFRRPSATAWATILHLHRGTPYVYQGEEIGMTNVSFTSIEQFRDIEALGHYAQDSEHFGTDPEIMLASLRAKGRDNARTPVQWDGGENAGFTTGTPWIEVNDNWRQINVAADRAAERSIFEHFRRLIRLRHTDETVALGRFTMLEPEHPRLYAFTRTLGDDQLLVMGNMSDDELRWAPPEGWADSTLVLGNYDEAPATAPLRPWEARIHRRRTA
jgi:oligo-1,6-glucosidase